jgi:hypothetical protein
MAEHRQKESAPVEAAPAGRRRKPLLLRILLDTNQLYTGSASDLLRLEVKGLKSYVETNDHLERESLAGTPIIGVSEAIYMAVVLALPGAVIGLLVGALLGHVVTAWSNNAR